MFNSLSEYNAFRRSLGMDDNDSRPSSPERPSSPPRISPVYSGGWAVPAAAMYSPPYCPTHSMPSFYDYPSHSSHHTGGGYHGHGFYGYPSHSSHHTYGAYSPYSSHSVQEHTRTVGGRTVRLVGTIGHGNGCVIDCVAMVSGVSQSRVQKVASDEVGFVPGNNRGLNFSKAETILSELGISSTQHSYSGSIDWRDFPDLAIVSVWGPHGGKHAVVYIYTDAGAIIFDANESKPSYPSDYDFCDNDEYLEIN